MKESPQEHKVRERMAALSRDGFMGPDSRAIAEVIEADRSELEAMGLTAAQVADRLELVLHKATDNLGRTVMAMEHLEVSCHEAMGRIPCPWGGCGLFAKGEIEALDRRTGARSLFTPLSIHLIRVHGFFEGKGARYRLEPRQVAQMLDLL